MSTEGDGESIAVAYTRDYLSRSMMDIASDDGNINPVYRHGMDKGGPGRRPSSDSEWKLAVIRRVIQARTEAKYTPAEMAALLSERTGKTVRRDTYRKYEILDTKKGYLLPHDLIIAFCDIVRMSPAVLLEAGPFRAASLPVTSSISPAPSEASVTKKHKSARQTKRKAN